jgi:hypothetical protein
MFDAILEERLRTELNRAQSELDQTRAKYAALTRRCDDRSLRSDGTITGREAQELVEEAKRRYRLALARFADFAFEQLA